VRHDRAPLVHVLCRHGASAPQQPARDDPDVYLVITYKNMAAFDDMQDRVDPIMEKVFGSQDQQSQANVERGKIRTVLGTELIRELLLK